MATDASTKQLEPGATVEDVKTRNARRGSSPAEPLLRPGEQVAHYIVLSMLGQGGFGQVFLAFDEHLKRKVALKVMHRELQQSDRQRFRREGEALAALAHPNVVSIFDVFEHGEHLVLAMEYVPGRNLTQWATSRGWREILEVLLQAARGLAAAHGAGLVHRDFKPDNVLVGDDGRARVADFGLAARGDSGAVSGLPAEGTRAPLLDALVTTDGMVRGTPFFMAPEVRLGKATDASDQFSFAKSVQLLLGRFPRGDGFEQVPPWVDPVVERGLAPNPASRWPGLPAVVLELATGLGVPAELDPSKARGPRIVVFTALGLLTLGLPTVAVAAAGDRAQQMDFLFALGTWGLAVSLGIGIFARKVLAASMDLRRQATTMLVFILAMVANRGLGWYWRSPVDQVLCIDLLLFTVGMANGALFVRRWMATSAVLSLAATALCVVRPSWSVVLFALVLVTVTGQMLFTLLRLRQTGLGFLDSHQSETMKAPTR